MSFRAVSRSSLGILTLLCVFACDGDKSAQNAQTTDPLPQGTTGGADPHAHNPLIPGATPPGGVAAHGANPHAGGPHAGGPPGASPHGIPEAPSAKLGITWTAPPAFEERPNASQMRAATYEVKGAAGPAEVTVFYFGPGGGGGVDANLERWVGQFEGAKEADVRREKKTIAGLTMHTVAVKSGTFSSGMMRGPSTPQENYGLLGAIVESPTGLYFFKMTGPAATVSASEAGFTKLLESIQVASSPKAP